MTYYCIDPGDYYFDYGDAVASLLSDEAVFVGGMSPFIKGDNDEHHATLWINCNDLWAWALADAMPLEMRDIEGIYVACANPAPFSFVSWICKRYRRRPVPEIARDMKAAGVWDEEMEDLPL